jgi:hypothetical protein
VAPFEEWDESPLSGCCRSRRRKAIYTQRMLERATTRVFPMLNRAAEIAPVTQACCGACRTCVTTNIFGVLAVATTALVSPLARFARRIASPS